MKKIDAIKKFVSDHRVAFAIVGTATAFLILMRRNTVELNKFLDTHNLREAYYALDEE